MNNIIDLKIDNIDVVMRNLSTVARDLPKTLQSTRSDVSNVILNARGLRRYPPETDANRPPVPYYRRGVGMQVYSVRNRGGRFISGNLKNSEQLKTRWTTIPYDTTGMLIANSASYAEYVHGEKQSRVMKNIGWLKLYDVAVSKISAITDIYNKHVNALIKKHNL